MDSESLVSKVIQQPDGNVLSLEFRTNVQILDTLLYVLISLAKRF